MGKAFRNAIHDCDSVTAGTGCANHHRWRAQIFNEPPSDDGLPRGGTVPKEQG